GGFKECGWGSDRGIRRFSRPSTPPLAYSSVFGTLDQFAILPQIAKCEANLPERRSFSKAIQSNFIAGVLTIIPLIVVWYVLDFIFTFLSAVGAPVASGFTMFVTDRM